MAAELQALLDRIKEQGVDEATVAADKIVADAREEAAGLVAAARKEAERLVSAAQGEADLLVEKGRESLRQAARDTLLSLREALQVRMREVVRVCAAGDVSAAQFGQMIVDMVAAYAASAGDVREVTALVGGDAAKAVGDHLMKRLGDDLRERTAVEPLPGVAGGFKLVFDGDNVAYDFTDAALADTLCEFVNPRLAELIRPDA